MRRLFSVLWIFQAKHASCFSNLIGTRIHFTARHCRREYSLSSHHHPRRTTRRRSFPSRGSSALTPRPHQEKGSSSTPTTSNPPPPAAIKSISDKDITNENSCRQFFMALNEHINQRVDQADDYDISSSSSSDDSSSDDDDDIHNVLVLDWDRDVVSQIQSSSEGNDVTTAGSPSSSSSKDWVQRFAQQGGFCIVTLGSSGKSNTTLDGASSDGPHASTTTTTTAWNPGHDQFGNHLDNGNSARRDVSAAWNVTKAFFHGLDQGGNVGAHENTVTAQNASTAANSIRYQRLVRRNHNDDDDDDDSSGGGRSNLEQDNGSKGHRVGYDYIEIGSYTVPPDQNDNTISLLQEHVGDSSVSLVQRSVTTLSQIGKGVAALVVANLLPMPLENAVDLLNRLVGGGGGGENGLDSENRSSNNTPTSFQRLARYKAASRSQAITENLSGHCDWSIFTIVPVSDVAGLQTYAPHTQSWVAIEEVARQHAMSTIRRKEGTAASTDYQNLPNDWNAGYLVVMTGKWLELLTNGRIESTIHRVVSPRDSPRRYSAPFFLRLQLQVLDKVQELELEEPRSMHKSINAMSDFLQFSITDQSGQH